MTRTSPSRDLSESATFNAREFSGALIDLRWEMPAGIADAGKAQKRFSVYRNNVVLSLITALGGSFPSVRGIAGEENFNRIARAFIASSPPSIPMMQDYGSDFPAFLKRFPPLANSPFLADTASAERLWLEAYHACDLPPLDAAILTRVPQDEMPDLSLVPHPAARMIASPFPVAMLFSARDQWPIPNIDLDKAQTLFISRPGLSVTTAAIEPGAETAFAEALLASETLGTAVRKASGIDTQFDAGPVLALIFQMGMFSEFRHMGKRRKTLPNPPENLEEEDQ